MQSGQSQCSSVLPQYPHFEQQKYSLEGDGSHSAGSPFGRGLLDPHLPSDRKVRLPISVSVTSSISKSQKSSSSLYDDMSQLFGNFEMLVYQM